MSPGASPSPTRVGEPAPLEVPHIPQAASLTPLHTGITTQTHARMWFVRWAKTSSEDGIEVDFLLNNAMPASKSRICTFAQLNPGDYLVEEEDKATPWHHYLVTEVTSHSTCSAIESWNWKVKDRNLTFNESTHTIGSTTTMVLVFPLGKP